jgi:hypothetical protein
LTFNNIGVGYSYIVVFFGKVGGVNGSEMAVARSSDGGQTWTPTYFNFQTGSAQFNDKPMITVDNTPGSPHEGTVYVGWDNATGGNGSSSSGNFILLSHSSDRGVTFSAQVAASDTSPGPKGSIGADPFVAPDGTVQSPGSTIAMAGSRRAAPPMVANKAVHTYDRSAEAAELASTLQGAVTQTAVAGAGAVGLGVGIAVLIGTTAADITGITAGLALAGLGLAVIPYHRSRAKAQFDARTRELSETLTTTLREQFNREIASGKQRLQGSLAPYTRFVRIESERVAQVKDSLERLHEQIRELRRRIDGGESEAVAGE